MTLKRTDGIGAGKDIKPGRVRRMLRMLARGRQELSDLVVDALLYSRERLRGRSFGSFYAEKMDRLATVAPTRATGRPEAKRFQFEYLRKHGLAESTRILDYGCGTAAAGIHMVKFLGEGRYTGADISAKVLEVAKQRIADAGLAGRNPRFVHLDDAYLSPLAGLVFDIVWAQSVLTHMPPDDIRRLLRNVRPLLAQGGAFYATFAYIPTGVQQRRIKDWYYGPKEFAELAATERFACRFMEDWQHPDGDVDRLAALTPVG